MTKQNKTATAKKHLESIRESKLDTPLSDAPCFIETQFPVAKVSMESYKERSAKQSQTLTGLGKWWGRKPLVLVRATILGLLLPSSDNPTKDREIFLKLMTMDEDGLWHRKNKSIPHSRLLDELILLPPSIQKRFLEPSTSGESLCLRRLSRDERLELQQLVFNRMNYSEKLKYCCRPEHLKGPTKETWLEINEHLKTNSTSLSELTIELSLRKFGHIPRVGDSFCGAGSIPFEAARLGCNAYASDLSPVAAMLTWAAFNVVGSNKRTSVKIEKTQRKIFTTVDQQITEWGIEHNEKGWRADIYLYCVEVTDPETGWKVPLLPSRIVSKKYNAIAQIIPNKSKKRYDIQIETGVSSEQMYDAADYGTISENRIVPPGEHPTTPIDFLRRSMRMWENCDVVPRSDDVFQELLYCIRWVETYYERCVKNDVQELTKGEAETIPEFELLLASGELKQKTRHHFMSPNEADFKREQKVLRLLSDRFSDWQAQGYIPSRRIEPGTKTDEPIRTRGWTHWHHLFAPRQLLLNGLLLKTICEEQDDPHVQAACLLCFSRCTDYNARLSRWHPRTIGDKSEQVFSNQALNTMWNYAVRGTTAISPAFFLNLKSEVLNGEFKVLPLDVRNLTNTCDIWITDPPYADAINYHELGEFFLAWYEKHIPHLFPNWYNDSKRALAVRGNDINFRQSMVECYRRLAEHMPANGMQIVMFTHQDASVWADLTMILWAAGLRVTAAWCIATETDSALKQGNYVQGTVLLICRKRTENEPVFLDEINHRVETEVRGQLNNMLDLEDGSDPNFADADYQLAAYAAALRVLTERPIEEIDPVREILRERSPGEIGPVERLIRNAVRIACDHLVPDGIDREIWKTLASMERFYLKGLEVETHGEHRSGVYQELARGFGAADYTDLLHSDRANQTRLKTAKEFERRMLSGEGFSTSLTRQCLFAAFQVTQNEQTADGLNWLKTELFEYWTLRDKIVHILDYLGKIDRVSGMDHWHKDSESARLLAGMVRNDHV